jgi:hypothetical protein
MAAQRSRRNGSRADAAHDRTEVIRPIDTGGPSQERFKSSVDTKFRPGWLRVLEIAEPPDLPDAGAGHDWRHASE